MKRLRQLFPYPFLAGALTVLWLALNQSIEPLDVTIGIVLGLTLSRFMLRLDPDPPLIRKPLQILSLTAIVARDIFISNLQVLAISLNLGPRPTSGFLNIPLQLRDRYGLAALATIVTSTPGTFWAAYDRRTGVLTIHVLDLREPAHYMKLIKGRYERRLLEIFG